MDVARRQRHRAAARLRGASRTRRAAVGRRDRRRRAARSTASSSTPRSCTPKPARAILENFLHQVAAIAAGWEMSSFVDDAIERIRDEVGDANVLCALSGGVDSAVAATLVARAIGKQLTCIFVDTGLMRNDEAARRAWPRFATCCTSTSIAVDAEDRFLAQLGRRRRSGREADPHRSRVHRDLRRRSEARSPASVSSCRGRSIRTSSSRRRRDRKPATRSNRTTTSAACPNAWSSGLIEPLRDVVQRRGAQGRHGPRLARRDRAAPAVPRARGWRCASSARSTASAGDRARCRLRS